MNHLYSKRDRFHIMATHLQDASHVYGRKENPTAKRFRNNTRHSEQTATDQPSNKFARLGNPAVKPPSLGTPQVKQCTKIKYKIVIVITKPYLSPPQGFQISLRARRIHQPKLIITRFQIPAPDRI